MESLLFTDLTLSEQEAVAHAIGPNSTASASASNYAVVGQENQVN